MLSELDDIVGKATSDAAQQTLEIELRAAARTLLEKQFLFADDFQGSRRFDVIRKHKVYFSNLFDAFGFDLVVDEREQLAAITSQTGVAQRRMSINDTLFLLALRIVYEERVKDFMLKEGGRADSSLAELWDLVEERSGRVRPSVAQCRKMAESFARNGLIKLMEPMPEGDLGIEIRPSIIKAITVTTAEELERFRMEGWRSAETASADVAEPEAGGEDRGEGPLSLEEDLPSEMGAPASKGVV